MILLISVRAFIELGVDPNEQSSSGATCLRMTKNSGTKVILNDIFNKKAKEYVRIKILFT